MFSKKDNHYMQLAINLARERIGLTGSNPSVGCIIVKDGEIISTGQTGFNGRPHAEYEAIKNCKKNLTGSSLYVSLEPCSHFGITPPCTNIISNSKIKKVYYSIDDIDLRTANKAKKILKSKKIIVKKNLLKKFSKNIYKSYFFNKSKKLPYVIGKMACSKDNLISSNKKYITNKYSINLAHLLRYKNQGILISYKTLNIDNPKLTCRLNGLEKYSPIRFILDKNLKTKKNSYIVKTAKMFKTFIFFNKSNSHKKKYFIKSGVKLIKLTLNKNNMFDLVPILKIINKYGVSNLLVEGGKNLTNNFLKNKLFNEFYLFKSNRKLIKSGSVNISNILTKLKSNFNYKKKIYTYLDKDQLTYYY